MWYGCAYVNEAPVAAGLLLVHLARANSNVRISEIAGMHETAARRAAARCSVPRLAAQW